MKQSDLCGKCGYRICKKSKIVHTPLVLIFFLKSSYVLSCISCAPIVSPAIYAYAYVEVLLFLCVGAPWDAAAAQEVTAF